MDGHLKFSIAEAKNKLPALIHQAERSGRVDLTRRGKSVAVILSLEEYNRISGQRQGLWNSISKWRAGVATWEEPWSDAEVDSWRNADPGRPVDF
jgi:antitoxin Phd